MKKNYWRRIAEQKENIIREKCLKNGIGYQVRTIDGIDITLTIEETEKFIKCLYCFPHLNLQSRYCVKCENYIDLNNKLKAEE